MNDNGQKNSDLGPVRVCLICGTGRSATTVVRQILAKHPEVAAMPDEHHFIADPDGLVDFYVSMGISASPRWFDVKLRRLGRLLHRVSRTSAIEVWPIWLITGINRLSSRRTIMSPSSYAPLRISQSIPTFPRT